MDYLRGAFAQLEPDTFVDFVEKNQVPHPIPPEFVFGGRMVPVSEQQQHEIFTHPDGWDRFRKLYPESVGTIYISRVGFNRTLTQALIYVGQHLHLSGSIRAGIGFSTIRSGNHDPQFANNANISFTA